MGQGSQGGLGETGWVWGDRMGQGRQGGLGETGGQRREGVKGKDKTGTRHNKDRENTGIRQK